MSWFKQKSAPLLSSNRVVELYPNGDEPPVRDALVAILEALRAEARAHNRANYDRLLTGLETPTPPADLLRDINDVLARRSSGPSAFTGARESREYGDMARNLTVALRRATISDPGLVRQIDDMQATVPRNLSPEDARQLACSARRIDKLAGTVRQRAVEDRIATAHLLDELTATLIRAGSEAAKVEGLARDPITTELEAAFAITDRLSTVLARQGEELVDVHSRTAMDPLTEVCHRGTFNSALAVAVRRAQTTRKPLALLVADIDYFGNLNESFGFDFGDTILIKVAQLVRAQIRDLDIVARVGGGAFAILLPGAPSHVAVSVGERIRGAIADSVHPVDEGPPVRLTVSVGAALMHSNEDPERLYARADKALRLAKESGRNSAELAV